MQESPFDHLDDLYQEVVLDHYRNPRNKGDVDEPHLYSRGFNPFCGDEVVLRLKLDSYSRIELIRFQGQGCSISQASASILTQLVMDKSIREAQTLSLLLRKLMKGQDLSNVEMDMLGDMESLKGVQQFPIRIKCALLAWATLDDCIAEYQETPMPPEKN